MSASATPPTPSSRFSEQELDMLARTADAMSAYLGKPVLAEVDQDEDGNEWVTFGVPLDRDAKPGEEQVRVQLGGDAARLLGQRGGLPDADAYDCLYLWAVQLTQEPGERFVKIDQDGEASAWSDALADVLPFALSDAPLEPGDLDDEDDEDEDDEDEDDEEADRDGRPARPHGGH
ncbi:hypothetical protein [Bordetella sp. 2513F-2]